MAKRGCKLVPSEPSHSSNAHPANFPRTFQTRRVAHRSLPQLTSLEPSHRDVLDQWRQHFVIVGAQVGGSFDENFFRLTMRGSLHYVRHPSAAAHSTSHFLLQIFARLCRCAESALGADGLSCCLFKVGFPWWQTALLRLYNLALS